MSCASLVAAVCLLFGLTGSALARDRVRVRWFPATGAPIDGYLVHVRLASDALFSAPRDVGLPAPRSDGSFEAVIDGLTPFASYVVAVSAYGAGGTRSERSNELVLLPRLGPCAFGDEGAACDPCVPGTCSGGVCVVAPSETPPLGSALRARFVVGRRRVRATGAFVPHGSVDPLATGATVELVGADGAILHRAELPPDGFRVGARGREFRWVAAKGAPGGVRRLVLRRGDDVLQVRLRAHARVSFARAVEPLRWVVRLGDSCMRQLDMRCYRHRARVRCR